MVKVKVTVTVTVTVTITAGTIRIHPPYITVTVAVMGSDQVSALSSAFGLRVSGSD